ncbi:hypothetical protein [Methanosalsum natronophilum]|uniref:Holliday junction resolvase n=1 Tax=Methanosalsum natronophilum TaxID=768733 RepID=A0A3R7VY80_9EURY|nr:hypothetical protein [Methanosalsum natronophilum]MCS3923787.1 hypothetical protein [Methanosalsum natronophilum]RQD85236.1 MAG: hypothetical protein D5R95_05110 [Methanosalsum natronophilum]
MTTFERDLVQSFNHFFEKSSIKGIAYRMKQHRFTHQYLDILVDSLNPDYYIGIECKSISVQKGANALYFTQHFTKDKNGVHQIERISKFLKMSGRMGFLAIELRLGAGKSRKAYAIPWNILAEKFNSDDVIKLSVPEIEEFPVIKRCEGNYIIDPVGWRESKRILE